MEKESSITLTTVSFAIGYDRLFLDLTVDLTDTNTTTYEDPRDEDPRVRHSPVSGWWCSQN